MGISVGWGDEYEWYLAWQWVDITGAAGRDLHRPLQGRPVRRSSLEENEGNQCTWARVALRLNRKRGDASTSARAPASTTGARSKFATRHRVGLRRRASPPAARPTSSAPNSAVTRGQMATFLARALDLPATATRLLHRRRGQRARGEHQPHRRGRHHGRLLGDAVLPATAGDPRPDGELPVPRARTCRPPATDYFTDDNSNKHEATSTASRRPASPPAAAEPASAPTVSSLAGRWRRCSTARSGTEPGPARQRQVPGSG